MTPTTINIGSRPPAKAARIRCSPAWAAAVARLIGWIAQEWRIRRDIRALAALGDRQLADIGLCRVDVDRILARRSRGISWELW